MKFQARVKDLDLFVRFVHSIEKIGRECVIQLTSKKMHVVIVNEGSEDVSVWGAVDVDTLFDHYRVHSLSNDEFAMRLQVGNLIRALRTGSFEDVDVERSMLLKLIKKGKDPFLNCLVEVQKADHTFSVLQDVPIVLLSPAQTRQYTEPPLPPPVVEICLPSLKHLRTITDKMKQMSELLTIRASGDGELTLSVTADMVQVQTRYTGLPVPVIEQENNDSQSERVGEAVVHVKKFVKVLHSYQIIPKTVVCSIVEDRAVVVNEVIDALYLTFFIPVVLRPDDDV